MATKKPHGDLVGWRIDTTHFQLGKTTEISSLDKHPLCTKPDVGFEPTTSHSLSGGVTPMLVYCLNQSATLIFFLF